MMFATGPGKPAPPPDFDPDDTGTELEDRRHWSERAYYTRLRTGLRSKHGLPPGYRLVRRLRKCGRDAVRWTFQWKVYVGKGARLSRVFYTIEDTAHDAWLHSRTLR